MKTVRTVRLQNPDSLIAIGQSIMASIPPQERFNVFSHLAGAILNSVVTLILIARVVTDFRLELASGLIVFGLCMSASYLASVAYHSSRGRARLRMLRWDRAGIYLAIAGYHTVNATAEMAGTAKICFLLATWILALYFIRREFLRRRRQRSCGVLSYCVLGLCGLVAWKCLTTVPLTAGMPWLSLMGLLYIMGVVMLRSRSVPANHELWHILVMCGNACMFAGWLTGGLGF